MSLNQKDWLLSLDRHGPGSPIFCADRAPLGKPALHPAMISPPTVSLNALGLMRTINRRYMLDLGAGAGINAVMFKLHCYHGYFGHAHGFDLHPANCIFREWYDKFVPGDILKTAPEILFTTNASQAFICCTEVIEHLSKEDGLQLLEMIRLSRIPTILSTPATPFAMHHPADGLSHLSAWTRQDIEGAGFKINVELDINEVIFDTSHKMWLINMPEV